MMSVALLSQPQSRWEQGISIGMSYSDYKESIASDVSNSYTFETILKSSFSIWTAYHFTPNSKISAAPGFSWKGGRQVAEGVNYEGVYFDLPIVFHRRLLNRLFVSPGVAYNYMIHLGEGSDRESYNLTSYAENRHFLSFLIGASYKVSHFLDVNVNYSQSINTVYTYHITNSDGTEIADIDLKNRGLQLLLTFYH